MSVRTSSASSTAARRSTAIGVKVAASVGISRAFHSSTKCSPKISARSASSERCDLRLGDDHRFLALGHFGFGLDDVDRRHRADLDAGAVLLERALRQVERQPLHFEAADGEDQVPVGVLHEPGGRGHRLAHQHVGDLAVLGRDLQLLAGDVDAEVAQQRLREVEGERRADLRREVGEGVVGGRPVVVPADAVARSDTRAGIDPIPKLRRFWLLEIVACPPDRKLFGGLLP